jgi:hypothetical protein
MTTRVSPAGFAAALRRLKETLPGAVEDAMVEGAQQLGGALVQREIASTGPHQPVDQGQYKAGWQVTEVKGGAIVGNSTQQAVWMERGRGPGPVPFSAILAWVKRKGFAKAKAKEAAKGRGRDAQGRFKGASKSEIEDAEVAAAHAITASIARKGIEPRWVLRRALTALGPSLKRIIRRRLREVRP